MEPSTLVALLQACLARGDAAAAYELVSGRDLSDLSEPAQRALVARVCVAAGRPEEALRHAEGDAPELMMARAAALAALGRTDEGRAAYEHALAGNPALEDRELLGRLEGRVRSLQRDGARLRVVSNDDTSAADAERLIEPERERITFADVGGLDDVKERIRRKIILPFQKPSLFQRFKKQAGGGILFYGPPGCGKTLLARATAGEVGAKFYNVAISDVLDMYIGESERKLHAIFQKARSTAPAVLFFDEIEALGGKRQYAREASSAKVVSQFLSEMDGFAHDNKGVLVLGATNVPWAVDSAFRRPGRFDRVQFIRPPDRIAREAILAALLRERPVEGRIDTASLAQATSGFSGADLRHLVETAIESAIAASVESGREVPITEALLRQSLREVKPTTLEWLTTARNYARYSNEGGQYDDVLEFLAEHGKA